MSTREIVHDAVTFMVMYGVPICLLSLEFRNSASRSRKKCLNRKKKRPNYLIVAHFYSVCRTKIEPHRTAQHILLCGMRLELVNISV